MQNEPLLFRLFTEIGIISQLSESLFERIMPQGMTLAQFTVLNHFVRLGGERSPAQLAAAFQVTRATMTSTLQRLEGKRLVTLRADPGDGRAKLVSITREGQEMRMACVKALEPELLRLNTVIAVEQAEALLPGLTELRQILDADRNRPTAC
jgi:DNA-binding MarR family transcriptional regulator